MRKTALLLTLSSIALAGAATAQQQAQAPVTGYLSAAQTPEAAKILAPPPDIGSPRQVQDMAVFKATRAGKDGDRWKLAAADNDYTPAAMLDHFACAMDVRLTPQTAPTLARMIRRTTIDAGRAANSAKEVFQRQRPYVLAGEGDICIAKSAGLAASMDYPSGHASLGWIAGLAMAELIPERSSQIVLRARAFGESRVYCGVHTPSAVEAGRTNASAVFAAIHSSSDYAADVAAARAEIAAARAAGQRPDAAQCSAEAELIAKAPG